jgi:hypothetical protein
MNRFADIANQAKSQHQQAVDDKAAKDAEEKRLYEERKERQRQILATEIRPIFEEARAGFVAAGLPATIEQEDENLSTPKLTLKIARQVDANRRPFEVSSKLSGFVDLEKNVLCLGRTSFNGGPSKYTYAPVGEGEAKITSEIEAAAKAWFSLDETFKGR